MAKRAAVPEGKSLFFRRAEGAELADSPGTSRSGTTRQSAIFLAEEHLDWLDEKCREARKNGGRAIRKAVIIRALLDAAMAAPIDLTGLRHEDDLRTRIRAGLKG
jgi:hypothetical protein